MIKELSEKKQKEFKEIQKHIQKNFKKQGRHK